VFAGKVSLAAPRPKLLLAEKDAKRLPSRGTVVSVEEQPENVGEETPASSPLARKGMPIRSSHRFYAWHISRKKRNGKKKNKTLM